MAKKKRKVKKIINMEIVPCKACKHLNRISVGYVSYRCQCKLNHSLGIWETFDKPHPDCPLKNNKKQKSNIDMSWLKLNRPNEYTELLERLENKE